MSFFAIVELAIGMVFAWLFMSVSAMFLQEWLAGILSWRPNMLEKTLRNMTGDKVDNAQLYNHPLIQSLHSGNNANAKPSYIPAKQFSLAMMDMIQNAGSEAYQIQYTLYDIIYELNSQKPKQYQQAVKKLEKGIEFTQIAIANKGNQSAIQNALNEVKKIIRETETAYPKVKPIVQQKFTDYSTRQQNITNDQSDLNSGLSALAVSSPTLQRSLNALSLDSASDLSTTDRSLNQFRENIETWFTNSMDRLSGWYKRRAQVLAFWIGLIIALTFNVDSFQLANQLWRDPTVREVIAIQADNIVSTHSGSDSIDPNEIFSLALQIDQLNIPVGWIGTPMPMTSDGAVFIAENVQKRCVLSPASTVEISGLRFGSYCYPIINMPVTDDIYGWTLKLLGFLVTAAATAQGAPFWFDILKNLVNVRSSGAVPTATATAAK